jgi:hypothetical protein
MSVSVGSLAASAADANFNELGGVDGQDLALWKAGYGIVSGANHHDGDADGDFDVDGADYLVWQRQLGSSSAVAATGAIPEPATWMLLSFAAGGGTLARRRRIG